MSNAKKYFFSCIFLTLCYCHLAVGQQAESIAQRMYDDLELSDKSFKEILINRSIIPVTFIEKPPKGGIPPIVWIITGAGGGAGIFYLLTKGDDGTATDSPVARNDEVSISCNGSGSLNVLTNDSGTNIQIINTGNISGIEISYTSGGIINISNVGINSFSFSYTISDDQNQTASGTVMVNVVLGQISTAEDIFSFDENTQVTGNVLGNDLGDMLIVTGYTESINGVMTISPNGDLSFTPNPGFCGTETLTYEATDICGQQATGQISLSAFDNTNPETICPPEISIQCNDSTDPSETGQPQVSDNCSTSEQITINYTDDLSGLEDCNETGVIIRTWTVADAAGNNSGCDQIIQVVDSNPPVINCPVDIEVICSDPIDPATTGTAEATDDCGESAISFQDNNEGLIGCGLSGIIIRTWSASDACGNTAICGQTITILEDSEVPTVDCAPDITISCNDPLDPSVTGSVTATDDCSDGGQVTIEYTDITDDPTACNRVIMRVWTAIDACGNTGGCTQNITLEDLTAPVITCPNNTSVPCNIEPEISVTGIALAEDDCSGSNVQLSSSDIFISEGICAGTITRTWEAIDNCGNITSCDQIIVLEELPCDFTFGVSISDASCGSNNGTAIAEISPGTNAQGPFTVLWSDGQTGIQANGLSAGDYEVTVMDNGIGCELTVLVEIGENPPEFVLDFDTNPVSCNGNGDIHIDLQSPGTGPFDVFIGLPEGGVIDITNVPNDNTFVLSDYLGNPPAGSYNFIITDISLGTSCQQSFLVVIDEIPPPVISIVEIIPASSPTSADGQIAIETEGGLLPLGVYVNDIFQGNIGGFNFVITDVPLGNYQILVIDANECASNILEVFMESMSTFSVQAGSGITTETFPESSHFSFDISEPNSIESLQPMANDLVITRQITVRQDIGSNISLQLNSSYNKGRWIDGSSNPLETIFYDWVRATPYARWNPSFNKSASLFFDFGVNYHMISMEIESFTGNGPGKIDAKLDPGWFYRGGLEIKLSRGINLQLQSGFIKYDRGWSKYGELIFQFNLSNLTKKYLSNSYRLLNFSNSFLHD